MSKVSEFIIFKKNRKYFKAKFSNDFEFKLLINDDSKDLDVGTHELLLEDVSIRTKYGTDVIYQVSSLNQKENNPKSLITLSHFMYNKNLVDSCKKLGGKWDADNKVWVFSSIVEDVVEELDALYNSELVNIEITALTELDKHTDAVCFLGYPCFKATGRDSGARICDGISLISGGATSTGSMKNWHTTVKEGTVWRMQVPKALLEEYEGSNVSVKILGKDDLILEVAKLIEKKAEDHSPRKEGQIWQPCKCGEEPVYLPFLLCEKCWPN